METRAIKASDPLSAIESRYQLLVDSITDYAIYMLNPDGLVASWNIGAERLKGYSPVEIVGEHFSRFYTPEDRNTGLPERALKTAASTGRFENEGWRVRKDASQFWAHVIIDAIHSPEGELLGFAKVTRDLTERKLAEGELRRSEQQFRLLVQGVTDYAIYMLDPVGIVTSWNDGAKRIKGYSAEDIIGEHFSRFYTEEDLAEDLPQMALRTAASEGRFEMEGWRVRKNGTRFWAHIVIDAIRDDAGDLVGFAKITRDITEKKDAQQALDKAREELFQFQKMEAVGQLTGGIAHDFNNLLGAVLGSLEILRRRLPDAPEITRLIDNAIQGANRGAALTQQLLAFSRRQALQVEAVDLLDLVRGMKDLLERALGPEMVIETRFPLSLPKVRSDSNQLVSALLNLSINARDAMSDKGTLTLSAFAKHVSPGEVADLPAGHYVCLSVTDEGQGMDAETLEKATAPFFTTKGVGKGTGLGLSMVHGLMGQSGGKLVLKSVSNVGTTAELWLPVENSHDDKLLEGDPAISIVKVPPRALSILTVDDDALVLMNTVLLLEDMGHDVIEATSGSEAMAWLENGTAIDLVITDHAMPRMTGTELAALIKLKRPDLPVILATGYAEVPSGGNTALTLLQKPFTQAQLADVIAKKLRS